jgi:hypothetical protein
LIDKQKLQRFERLLADRQSTADGSASVDTDPMPITGDNVPFQPLRIAQLALRGARMAKQPVEFYAEQSVRPLERRCAVPGCTGEVVAEVHEGDYGRAAQLFYGGRRRGGLRRRAGEERIYACSQHLITSFRWQRLLPF